MNITLLSCTQDSSSFLFKKHLNSIKQCTNYEFEHLIFDNNHSNNFNHAKEINRAVKITDSKFLVTLDDDVIVTPNWLSALITAAKKNKAQIVGGIHRYKDLTINHSGAFIQMDGYSRHFVKHFKRDTAFPYVCSAVMLMDMNFFKQQDLFFDEIYEKYYQEVDLALRVWEQGGKVISTPKCDLFHLVSKTAKRKGKINDLAEKDYLKFNRKWVETERLKSVLKKREKQIDIGGFKMMDSYHKMLLLYRDASKINSLERFKQIVRGCKALEKYDFGKELIGGASFHIGKILFGQSNYKQSKSWLEKACKFIPDHKKAKLLLKKLK